MFVMALFGTPFAWKKVRGGFNYPWVGLEINLAEHSLGISQERADWLIAWIDGAMNKGSVLVREFGGVLGRLTYAADPLERLRPFLSCIYAWVAVVPDSAFLEPPLRRYCCA